MPKRIRSSFLPAVVKLVQMMMPVAIRDKSRLHPRLPNLRPLQIQHTRKQASRGLGRLTVQQHRAQPLRLQMGARTRKPCSLKGLRRCQFPVPPRDTRFIPDMTTRLNPMQLRWVYRDLTKQPPAVTKRAPTTRYRRCQILCPSLRWASWTLQWRRYSVEMMFGVNRGSLQRWLKGAIGRDGRGQAMVHRGPSLLQRMPTRYQHQMHTMLDSPFILELHRLRIPSASYNPWIFSTMISA